MVAKLFLKHDGITLATHSLNKDVITLGRNPDNDIQLDDPSTSGQHARITRKANEYLEGHYDYYLEDLGSTNGSIVNDQKVIKQMLKQGDMIKIGSHNFRFDMGQEDFETTAIYIPDEH